MGFRRVDTEPGGGIGVGSRTDEFKGDLRSSLSWRKVNVGGVYESLLSRYRYRERRRELATHADRSECGLCAGSAASPVGGNVLQRWGHLTDNAVPACQADVDEAAYGAQRPVPGDQ